MEQRTKFTDNELDHIHMINVFEFDLIKEGNGISFGEAEYFRQWNGWELQHSRENKTKGFKIYCIYPDICLNTYVNRGAIMSDYFTWDSSEYHYIKKDW